MDLETNTFAGIRAILAANGDVKTLDDFNYEDFEIVNYNPDAGISAPVAV